MAARGKKVERKTKMIVHKEGVQELADTLEAMGYHRLPYDEMEGETLPPFSFSVSERYRWGEGANDIVRDIVLRTDGPVIDVKLYHYKDEDALHTSIMRVPAYLMLYRNRRPAGSYLSIVTSNSSAALVELMGKQGGGFDPRRPHGIWLLRHVLERLERYRAA